VIRNEDIHFHRPDGLGYDWAETGFFNFYVPARNLHGWVYIVHRTGLGVSICGIEIVDAQADDPAQARYVDMQNHLPIPERAEAFTLPNGLSFTAGSIRDYRIDYQGFDDTELHLEITGIMEPYDIHDPNMDPMAVADPAANSESTGFGAAYSAHFDMSVRVAGSLRLRGENIDIDCLATMDHSWGPRPESAFSAIAWVNGHFEDGSVLHSIWSLDRAAPRGEQHTFRHGYALVDGRVRGVLEGDLVLTRRGHFGTAGELRLVDVDGTEHRAHSAIRTSHYWVPYANCPSPISMHQFHMADGRSGIGTVLEGFPTNRWCGTGQVAAKIVGA
jgi:hypothetical protein